MKPKGSLRNNRRNLASYFLTIPKNKIAFAAVFIAALAGGTVWAKPLKVVATTPELAALVQEVGREQVVAESLAKPLQNPHFVDAKPSLIVKVMNADLFVETGMGLEIGWAPLLIQSAGNKNVQPGSKGFLDASQAITPLEVPVNPDRSMGDVHPEGNPHYLLDPGNGIPVAKLIADRLSALAPQDSALFRARFEDFKKRLEAALARWDQTAKDSGVSGAKVVTYHSTWSYFVKRFGMEVVGYVEPKPGIPPSPRHMASLIALMKSEKVKLIIVEPYFDAKLPQKIALETGAKLALLPTTVGAEKDIRNYIDLFDRQIKLLSETLRGN